MLAAIGLQAKRIALETEPKHGMMRFQEAREPGRATNMQVGHVQQWRRSGVDLQLKSHQFTHTEGLQQARDSALMVDIRADDIDGTVDNIVRQLGEADRLCRQYRRADGSGQLLQLDDMVIGERLFE